ncbi:phosphatase PAP2 family protein [Acinetobacter qingfengensis]|nr:phosphatase PAP2 family protein [Acinetobacter qingfengensis]KAA8731891.1 phosphatase PAP2 family protein [Acinetobacter qingfengensis]
MRLNFLLMICFIVLTGIGWFYPANFIDIKIIEYIQQHQNFALTQLSQILSRLGGLPGTLILVAALFIYSLYQKRFDHSVLVVISFMLTVSVAWVVKWLVNRPRPDLDLSIVKTYGSSFPSAHSAYAMLIACLLIFVVLNNQLGWKRYSILLWALIMGWSRVNLGVHYPSDVLAGWVLAALIVLGLKIIQDRRIDKTA